MQSTVLGGVGSAAAFGQDDTDIDGRWGKSSGVFTEGQSIAGHHTAGATRSGVLQSFAPRLHLGAPAVASSLPFGCSVCASYSAPPLPTSSLTSTSALRASLGATASEAVLRPLPTATTTTMRPPASIPTLPFCQGVLTQSGVCEPAEHHMPTVQPASVSPPSLSGSAAYTDGSCSHCLSCASVRPPGQQ